MKAHRREAKGTALIECVQVAAEKAKWPIRDEFRRMTSRPGGARAATPPPREQPAVAPAPLRERAPIYEPPRPGASAAAPTGARAWRDAFLFRLWRKEALR